MYTDYENISQLTPAHDPNDYNCARRHNLPLINILNKNGTFNENCGIAGLIVSTDSLVALRLFMNYCTNLIYARIKIDLTVGRKLLIGSLLLTITEAKIYLMR